MSRYRNLLSLDDSLAVQSTSGKIRNVGTLSPQWTIAGGSYLVSDKRDERTTPNYFSLRITPSSTDAVQLTLNSVAIPQIATANPSILFHALGYSSNTLRVSSRLSVNGFTAPEANNAILQPYRFISFRSNHILLNDYSSATSINIRVQLTFTHHLGQPFFVTVPVLLDDNAFKANTFVRNASKFLPTFYLDLDAAAQNPDDPMMKLFDLMTASADDVSRLYVDYFDYELTEIAPGEDGTEEWARSKLTDPDYAEVENLEWLAQFSGVNLRSSVLYEQPSVTALADAPTSIVNQYYEGNSFYLPVTDPIVDAEYGGTVDGWTAMAEYLNGTNFDLSKVALTSASYIETGILDSFTLDFTLNPLKNLTGGNMVHSSISWKDPDTKEHFRVGCDIYPNVNGLYFSFPTYVSSFYNIPITPDSSHHPQLARMANSLKKIYDSSNPETIWDEGKRQEEAGFTITTFPFGYTNGDKALLMWFGDGDLNVDFSNWLTNHENGGVFYIKNGFTNYWTKVYFSGRYHIADPGGFTSNGETYLVFYDSISPVREPLYFNDPLSSENEVLTTVYPGTSISFDDDDLTVVSKYPTDEESEEFKRWQISSKYTGLNSGSREAITESVRLGLTGDKVVAISPNYNAKDWRIHIRTLTSETPTDPLHPITGQSAEVVALAELAKPVGFYITHSTVDKLFFTLNNVGIGRLNLSVLGDETVDPSGGGSTATEDII